MPSTKYQHIFFDLDHTIWDFETNSTETLLDLHNNFKLADKGIDDFALFSQRYNYHNLRLWDRYSKGFIKQDELRWKRMWLTLLEYKIADEGLSKQLSVDFLRVLPTKKKLFPHTIELLDYLKEKQYEIHLITNGFEAVQHAKLENSGLKTYFNQIITSEGSNHMKPQKEIFDFAFRRANTHALESIMIGDNLDADIQGGINAGMDTVFVNHVNANPHIKATYEIFSLNDLFQIL